MDSIGIKGVRSAPISKLTYQLISLDSDEPEWVIEQTKARKRREMLRQREDMEARLAKVRAKEKAQKQRYLKEDQNFKKRRVDVTGDGDTKDEEQFVLDDYESDSEHAGGKVTLDGVYSAATLALMDKLGIGQVLKEEEMEDADETKVS